MKSSRGEAVDGRPPILTVGDLTFKIEMASRKGQWLYSREPLTNPIPLSLTGILKAYDQQVKRIVNRQLESSFLPDLQKAWQDCLDKRKQRPSGGRINIVEVYAQLTLNRQNTRFWNAPSRSTFKDYERVLFVRELAVTFANRLEMGRFHRLLPADIATAATLHQLNLPQFQTHYRAASIKTMPAINSQLELLAQ